MSKTPAQSQSARKSKNLHLFGSFRWPVVVILAIAMGMAFIQLHPDLFGLALLAKEGSSHAWLKPVQEQLPHVLIFLIAFLLSYLLTLETGIRAVLAFFPGAAVASAIWLPFGWTNYGMVSSLGLGLFFWIIFYWRLCDSKWIGIRCQKCHGRGTIKMKLVKKDLLRTYYTRDENGVSEKREIFRRTIRYSCRFCGLAWTEVKED